jgi:uncharacterized protein YyaL (SSP411 family)
MLRTLQHQEKIEELRFQILVKAIFTASADGDEAKKEIETYNKMVNELGDLQFPERKKIRKSFEMSQTDALSNIKGKSVAEIIGKPGVSLKLGEKLSGEKKLKLTSKGKNFGKVN